MNVEDKLKEIKTPLDYKGFEEYKTEIDTGWGKDTQWIFKFDNNYGASVVKHLGSYGFDDDLFELAVIYFDDDSDNFRITYNTPITDDVLGWLTNDDVLRYLLEIKNLKEGN